MKTETNLFKSADARRKQCRTHSARLFKILNKDPLTFSDKDMRAMRAMSNDISQCVHEINAYLNCYKTE